MSVSEAEKKNMKIFNDIAEILPPADQLGLVSTAECYIFYCLGSGINLLKFATKIIGGQLQHCSHLTTADIAVTKYHENTFL